MNISITICEMNQPALLNIGLMAARKGAVELEFAVKKLHKLKVEKKGSTDYVTEVDRRVEQIIFEDIKSYYPEHNFLGEESGEEINFSNVSWILDPIDGTTNFINGFPHYCVSLCASVDGIKICLLAFCNSSLVRPLSSLPKIIDVLESLLTFLFISIPASSAVMIGQEMVRVLAEVA